MYPTMQHSEQRCEPYMTQRYFCNFRPASSVHQVNKIAGPFSQMVQILQHSCRFPPSQTPHPKSLPQDPSERQPLSSLLPSHTPSLPAKQHVISRPLSTLTVQMSPPLKSATTMLASSRVSSTPFSSGLTQSNPVTSLPHPFTPPLIDPHYLSSQADMSTKDSNSCTQLAN